MQPVPAKKTFFGWWIVIASIVTFGIDTDAPTDKVKKMIELTERYCVVAQTLANGASIDIAIE